MKWVHMHAVPRRGFNRVLKFCISVIFHYHVRMSKNSKHRRKPKGDVREHNANSNGPHTTLDSSVYHDDMQTACSVIVRNTVMNAESEGLKHSIQRPNVSVLPSNTTLPMSQGLLFISKRHVISCAPSQEPIVRSE